METFCVLDTSSLGTWHRASSDELDGNRTPPERGGGDYRGIGLLDSMWKVVEKIMIAQLLVIELHDCLHGGFPRRGMGMAIMEVEVNQ